LISKSLILPPDLDHPRLEYQGLAFIHGDLDFENQLETLFILICSRPAGQSTTAWKNSI